MKQYIDLCKLVLEKGIKKEDRTGTGTISYFGTQVRYDLKEGFPLLTTKKVHWDSVVHELLWFIAGDTNIKYLVDNGVRIWNEWPYQKYKKSEEYSGETLKEFAAKIKQDDNFAAQWGELGPVYGKQWRDFFGVDQLQKVIHDIQHNPDSRRLIISAWNPAQIDQMLLPPCHAFMQFIVEGEYLSLQLYQRSADVFLGVPFNIASYSLLLTMVAHVTGKTPKEFIHTMGDTHIYLDHLEQIETQINREPKKLPYIILNSDINDITKFKYEDVVLEEYDPHPLIKGKVSV